MSLMKVSKLHSQVNIDLTSDHCNKGDSTVKDNWISDFIFNDKIGTCCHFLSIISSILYLIHRMLMNDDFIKLLWQNVYSTNLPTVPYAITIELMMHLVVLIILLPLSKLSKSKLTKVLLTVTCNLIIFSIGFCDINGTYLTELGRIMIGIETVRLQLKVISFMVECSKDEKLFKMSNLTTLTYFLFIPTLIYKVNYERTFQIRWIRVISYVTWIFLLCTLYVGLFYEIFVPYLIIDLPNATIMTFFINILTNALFLIVFYIFIVTFMFFEVWCGFFAEILFFYDHQFFGPYFKYTFDTQFVADLNIVVSRWIKIYLFRPVLKSSQSLYLAFIVTFTLSMLYHEIIYSYALRQIVPLTLLWGPILATYFYIIRLNICHPIILLPLGVIGIFTYAYPHVLEFSARKFCSTQSSSSSSIRLIPLFVSCLIK